MAFPVTLNGRTYTLADFSGTTYVEGFPDALEDFVTQAGDIYNSTSTTSNAIGTGAKTFTVEASKPYQAGTPLRIADAAAPATNFLDAIVTSYSGTSLVVSVFGIAGSGTYTSWTVNIGGAKTVDGTLPVAQGGTGATTAANARTNLGLGAADSPSFAGLTATTADINGGTIDGTVIGGSTPAAISGTTGSFSSVTATEGTFSRLNVGANLQWNSSTDSYTANSTPTTVTKIHQGMKRCVLKDDGSVNYYLDPADSTEKLDGTSANLDGTDGNVMVEIPRFYFRQVRNGNTLEWQISDVPLAGYQLHPAFFKDGEIVDFRYMGAYDACVYDDSASAYIAGLNLDDNTSNVDTANDKLASVSGIFPMVGLTRDENRLLAANNGTGWRQQDFWITSAVQLLYLIEYGDFHSQSYLGAGNTNGSYLASSADQNDSPNTIAGASNSLGNASTNTTTGAGVSAKPGTSFMSYRGIENFFGNVFNWVDGFNILADHQAFVTNNRADFADNTSSGFELLGTLHNVNGFVTNILDVPGAFLPSAVGGSSSTFLADNYFQATGNRVTRFGGSADDGATAGAFRWAVSSSSSSAKRNIGARLSF